MTSKHLKSCERQHFASFLAGTSICAYLAYPLKRALQGTRANQKLEFQKASSTKLLILKTQIKAFLL